MPARTRPIIAALLVLASLALSASSASAAEVNVTGTWSGIYACKVGKCAGSEEHGVFVLNQPAGSSSVAGTLNVEGGGEGSVTGTVSGNTLTLKGKGSGTYEAEGVETISADGLSFSGSYKDSVGTEGTLSATRPSLPVFGAEALRPSAIQVLCNYEVAAANFICTASVGDASGAAPAKIPTGTVSFTAPSGGFIPVARCALVASPGSPNAAACSVTYTPAGKIPTGTPAPVTGAYSGDSVFAPSAAKSGTGAVVSPVVGVARSTGEGATATVKCPSGSSSCPITVTLSVEELGGGAVTARKTKRRKITIGSTAVTLKGGQQRAVKVSLNRKGKALLARHKRFTAALKVVSGGTVVKTERVALKSKHS